MRPDHESKCRLTNPDSFGVGQSCAESFAKVGFPILGCLGCGRQGCTFKTVEPWVVKVTEEKEAVIAKEIGDMTDPHPALYRVAKIDGRPAVIRLGKCAGSRKVPVYAVVREDLLSLTVADEGKFNFATARLESVARDILIDRKAWSTRFPSQSNLTLEMVHPADVERLKQFISFLQWTIARRIQLRDMILDNLGLRPGTDQLVARDIGVVNVLTSKTKCQTVFETRERPRRVIALAGIRSR